MFATPWIALFLAWLADQAEETRVLYEGGELGPIPEPERRTHGHHYLGSCEAMNYELPHWLTEFAVPVSYRTFAEETDIAEHRRGGAYWAQRLTVAWHVGFYKTTLPSGTKAYFLQHSGFEHLFAPDGVDLALEKRLAADAGDVIEGLESPATRAARAVLLIERSLLKTLGEDPYEGNLDDVASYLNNYWADLEDFTGLKVLGIGSFRAVFQMPGGEVMKIALSSSGEDSNLREIQNWERLKGTVGEQWLVPILGGGEQVVYMAEAEPAQDTQEWRNALEAYGHFAQQFPGLWMPDADIYDYWQWGIHEGRYKLLDYGE